MSKSFLAVSDFHLLYYFSVVAEECNISAAAERLFMSQPPLSRHIKRLEERLGMALFVRHTKGLLLTKEGKDVLETLRPLLALQEKVFQDLKEMADPLQILCTVGITTAFEQGIFLEVQKKLAGQYGRLLTIKRKTSPKLISDIGRQRIDAAFVALPVEAPGIAVFPLAYSEPLVAVLPACWPEAAQERLSLSSCSSRPLFWFKREENPAFYDYMAQYFRYSGFHPRLLEEPKEHDVLLARIACGEAMGLFPSSFSAISRPGVIFLPLQDFPPPQIRLGFAHLPDSSLGKALYSFLDFKKNCYFKNSLPE